MSDIAGQLEALLGRDSWDAAALKEFGNSLTKSSKGNVKKSLIHWHSVRNVASAVLAKCVQNFPGPGQGSEKIAVEDLFKVAVAVLDTHDIFKSVSMKQRSYDVEKNCCNLSSKLMETKEYGLAFSILSRLLFRLKKESAGYDKWITKNCLPYVSSSDLRARIEAKFTDISSVLQLDESDLSVPAGEKEGAIFDSLIVSAISNVTSCLISLMKEDSGSSRLIQSDKVLGGKFATSIFKSTQRAAASKSAIFSLIPNDLTIALGIAERFTLIRLSLRFYVLMDSKTVETLCTHMLRIGYLIEKELQKSIWRAYLVIINFRLEADLGLLSQSLKAVSEGHRKISLDAFTEKIQAVVISLLERLGSGGETLVQAAGAIRDLSESIESDSEKAILTDSRSYLLMALLEALPISLKRVIRETERLMGLMITSANMDALPIREVLSRKMSNHIIDITSSFITTMNLKLLEEKLPFKTIMTSVLPLFDAAEGCKRLAVVIYNTGCTKFSEKAYETSSWLFKEAIDVSVEAFPYLHAQSLSLEETIILTAKLLESFIASKTQEEDLKSSLNCCNSILKSLISLGPVFDCSSTRQLLLRTMHVKIKVGSKEILLDHLEEAGMTLDKDAIFRVLDIETDLAIQMRNAGSRVDGLLAELSNRMIEKSESTAEFRRLSQAGLLKAKLLNAAGSTDEAIALLARIISLVSGHSLTSSLASGNLWAYLGMFQYEVGMDCFESFSLAFKSWGAALARISSSYDSEYKDSERDLKEVLQDYLEIESISEQFDVYRLNLARLCTLHILLSLVQHIPISQDQILKEKFRLHLVIAMKSFALGNPNASISALSQAEQLLASYQDSFTDAEIFFTQSIALQLQPKQKNEFETCLLEAERSLGLLAETLSDLELNPPVKSHVSKTELSFNSQIFGSLSRLGAVRLMQDLLLLLINVTTVLGFVTEAEFYFKRAISLADESRSIIFKKIVLLLRAFFEFKKENEKECEKCLVEANALESLAVERSDLTWLSTILVGDASGVKEMPPSFRAKIYKFAEYAEVEVPLRSAYGGVYMESMKMCLRDDLRHVFDTSKEKDNIEDSLEKFALKQRAGRRVEAWISVGRMLEAEKLCALLSGSANAISELVERNLAFARLWFAKFQNDIQHTMFGDFLSTIAMLFPVSSKADPSHQSQLEQFRDRILELEGKLKDVFEVVYAYGSRANAQEVGQYLVYTYAALQVFRHQMSKKHIEMRAFACAKILVLRLKERSSLQVSEESTEAGFNGNIVDNLPEGWAMREGETKFLTFADVRKEFEFIMQENRTSTNSTEDYSDSSTRADWWKRRRNLDRKLGFLLHRVECAWLGGFKGLFLDDDFEEPVILPYLEAFQAGISQILSRLIGSKVQTDREVCRLILRLGPNPKPFELEDIVTYILFIQKRPESVSEIMGLDIEMIEEDLLVEIRKFYRRLKDSSLESPDLRPSHIILVIDSNLEFFPWESVPVLRGTSVSRMPCLSFLNDQRKRLENGEICASIDRSSAYFVLNPGGDLTRTQSEFEDLFVSQVSWEGMVGKPPSADQFMKGLQQKELFIYFGHGSGENFLRSSRIRTLNRCAVTLLMGCSSGKQHRMGEFDSKGTPLSYLIAGCPALAVNLWDVTDRDIDRFSRALMEGCGIVESLEGGSKTLAEAMAVSREECTLKYLNGASPVLYGCPVRFR
ncbi:hypothetical protein HDU67_008555 [Dinochytrium kinnereticum]|nr:hypothetical protein HDU67_008555 [Dinochytrium kinnereticum]